MEGDSKSSDFKGFSEEGKVGKLLTRLLVKVEALERKTDSNILEKIEDIENKLSICGITENGDITNCSICSHRAEDREKNLKDEIENLNARLEKSEKEIEVLKRQMESMNSSTQGESLRTEKEIKQIVEEEVRNIVRQSNGKYDTL